MKEWLQQIEKRISEAQAQIANIKMEISQCKPETRTDQLALQNLEQRLDLSVFMLELSSDVINDWRKGIVLLMPIK